MTLGLTLAFMDCNRYSCQHGHVVRCIAGKGSVLNSCMARDAMSMFATIANITSGWSAGTSTIIVSRVLTSWTHERRLPPADSLGIRDSWNCAARESGKYAEGAVVSVLNVTAGVGNPKISENGRAVVVGVGTGVGTGVGDPGNAVVVGTGPGAAAVGVGNTFGPSPVGANGGGISAPGASGALGAGFWLGAALGFATLWGSLVTSCPSVVSTCAATATLINLSSYLPQHVIIMCALPQPQS